LTVFVEDGGEFGMLSEDFVPEVGWEDSSVLERANDGVLISGWDPAVFGKTKLVAPSPTPRVLRPVSNQGLSSESIFAA
jgi:hypothetical protein